MNEMIESLKKKQIEDLLFLKKILIKIFREKRDNFGFDFSNMKDFKVFKDVITSCNEVDYNKMDTVMAYVMLHLLERYSRFQYMQLKLIENKEYDFISNLTEKMSNDENDYTIRILDVGTGPAPALLAFSDFYDWLQQYKNIKLEVNSDYIEKSSAFRKFLHFFTELAQMEGKYYKVPFHNGKHHDILEYEEMDRSNLKKTTYYKYDLVIFSNFLTTSGFVETIESNLKNIFNSMTNKSTVIISGGLPENENYRKIYDSIDKYFKRPFKHRVYKGEWKQIFSNTLKFEKSKSESGKIVNEYYREIKSLLDEEDVFEKLPEETRKLIVKGSNEGDHSIWHTRLYLKKSFDIRNLHYVRK